MVQQKVKYTDTERTPAERARALLEEMTLDEKMAQLGCRLWRCLTGLDR